MYLGDIRLGQTIEWTFTTRSFATGAPTTLAGTPSLEAYETGSSTPITAGITLTVDYSGVTGLNHVSLVASGANGFVTANDISVVIAAGTVGGVSVVGETVGGFSIENRSAVMPTTAGRTLDVTATGAAGVDWGNVENPTTTVGLSGTTVKTATDVETDTADIQTRLPAALTGGKMESNIGSITAGIIAAASFAAGAFDAVWSVAARVLTAATNITSTGGTTVPQTGDSFARLGAPAGASVSADIAAIPAAVWAVGTRTLTSFGSLVADVATAVWGAATRTLTSLSGNAADIRAAVGLASADLDTQLSDIDSNVSAVGVAVLTRATPADVNAQVLDVLAVDTFGEPTGVPPAADTIVNKIGRSHMVIRNGSTVDANTGKKQFLDDGGAAEWEKDFTDAGGVYAESEANAP